MAAVVVAVSYPVLDVFWTILWVLAFLVWIWLVVRVFGDLIRRRDVSGWYKAAWTIGIILFPLIGVIVYLAASGAQMHQRTAADSNPEGSWRCADEIDKLATLRDRGVITEEEFMREKTRLMRGAVQ